MELMMEHLANGFLVMLLITMPLVLTAASIGLVVGILQAVTSVQEQTIAAAPKILMVFLMIIILGGFFTKKLTDLMQESGHLAFEIIPRQGEFVLSDDVVLGKDGKYYPKSEESDIDKFMKNPGKPPYSEFQQKPVLKKTSPDSQSRPNLMESNKIMENRR
ncbi:MAG: flagellar biosynthetic protein FliQ [Candidatus Gastranaerophilales bacterium]|nr:flagellar biosynthetic protein FliQ [Candidatus Gastranaerophilales bacterium]